MTHRSFKLTIKCFSTWSDREIRTILTQLNELPLNYGMVERFDSAIINCSKNVKIPNITSPPFERYLDSKLVRLYYIKVKLSVNYL